MEAKYLIFLIALVVGVPLGILACCLFKPLVKAVFIFMVWATCVPDMVSINFFSREAYRSITRGIEVSLADLCALIVFFVMLLNPKKYKLRWLPPLTLPYACYILIGLLAWAFVAPPFPAPLETLDYYTRFYDLDFYPFFETRLYPAFELTKIIRGGFLFFVIVNFIRDDDSVRTLLNAFLITIFWVAFDALTDRYIDGINRVAATLGHPNSLATYAGMLGTVLFSICLYQKQIIRSLAFGLGTALSGLTVILTVSRGGLVGLAWGLYMAVSSLFHRFTNLRNALFLAAGVLGAAAVLAVASDTLMKRFFEEQDATADLEYRNLYNEEAVLMARDYFFGVGLGNFSAWSWRKYAEAVGLEVPGTPAHNLWYLTLGETGVLGLAAFAFYWMRYYALTLPFLFKKERTLMGAAAAAAVLGTLVGQWQNMLQLGYRQTPMFFLNMMLMGLSIGVLCCQRETQKEAKAGGTVSAPAQTNPLYLLTAPLTLFGLLILVLFIVKYFIESL